MNLRELRERKDLSQREVARRVGVSQPAIRGIEKRGSSRVFILEKYAEAIGEDFETVRIAAQTSRNERDMITDNYNYSLTK